MSTGVRIKNPFSPISLLVEETLEVLPRCSRNDVEGNGSPEEVRNDGAREEGGDSFEGVCVRARNVLSTGRCAGMVSFKYKDRGGRKEGGAGEE